MDANEEFLKKSYYAIIPAEVRYDERLPMGARFLYGEITALCNEKGYCWATNKYFAELYKVTDRTVRAWIASLVEYGYVISELKYKENSKEVETRFLKLATSTDFSLQPMENNFPTCGKNLPDPMENNFRPLGKNLPTPAEKIFLENNTCNNNTCNNTINNIVVGQQQQNKKNKRFSKPTIEEIKAYCIERNNQIDASYFYDYYESKGWLIGKNPMKDWKAAIRTWERKEFNKDGGKNAKSAETDKGVNKWSSENAWNY